MRHDGRRAGRAARARHRPRLPRAAARLGALRAGQDDRPLHRDGGGGRAALAREVRPRLDDGRVRDAPGVDRRADAARGVARAGPTGGRWRSSGSSAARSARSATSRRSASGRSGSTATSSRPTAGRAARRSPGAWIAARRALDRFGLSKALTGSIAAVSVGIVERRGGARPRLRGGLERGDGHERRHDRRRAPGRGAGDGRARPVLARAARRAARPRGRAGSATLTAAQAEAARGARRVRLVLASRNENKLRELRAALPTWEIDAPRRGRRARRGRHDVRRQRADQGAARATASQPATPGSQARTRASRWRRSAAGRASSRRAGRRTESRSSSPSSADEPDRRARYVCELVVLEPDGRRGSRIGNADGRDRVRAARRAKGSATTRSSSRDGESLTVAELGNAWKAEHSHRARAARALAQELLAERW